MRIHAFAFAVIACTLCVATNVSSAELKIDPALAAAVADPGRNPKAMARDAARRPAEELTFFGLARNMNVVELWPSTGYWTEILGLYLAGHGHYTVAHEATGDPNEDGAVVRWKERVASHKGKLGTIVETSLGPKQFDIAPPNSADLIVTFRNLHNWIDAGYADQVLAACFTALKPGGILGIEDHRGRNDQPQEAQTKLGYLRQDVAIALAKKAGFELVDSSELNANPKDTKDYPNGVWTLPPTLALGDKDRAKYVAIGEADNFVLKFRKPGKK
jgi:predicted methyltransferase